MKLRSSLLLTVLVAVSLLAVPPMASAERQVADTLYLNGNIYTADAAFSTAQAMAIQGDRFLYVGSNEGAMTHRGPGTVVVDLAGRTVLPGLMDSHNHFGSVGTNLFSKDINCYWLPLDELQSAIAAAVLNPAVQRPGGQGWIVCRGYNDAIWDPPVAHKDLLDPYSPNNPVAITRYCGHATLANSKAIELAGIDVGGITPDPVGGTIVRDANGNPTGVFIDTAQSLISRVIPAWPPLTEDERRFALQLGSQAVLASGLTVVHDASGASMSEVNRRKELYDQGLMKVRINNMLSASTAFALGAPQVGLYNNHYFLQSVKVIADGSLGGRGAAMIEEYSDMPGYYGALRSIMLPGGGFTEQTTALLALGFSTRTHAIGDLANRLVLDAYEAAMTATGKTGDQARLSIEHSQILHPADLPRFGQLGVVASMQPIHATEDMLFAEDRVGPVRILGGYAWSDLLDDGVVISAGSDYGVSPYNPFWGLYAAITRQDRTGWPEGGWYPAQRMTREEALRAYTNGGAYVMFAEDRLGSIVAGKLADFVVIDRDYMTTPAENMWRTRNLMTVVGGEVVYTAPNATIDIKPGSLPNVIFAKKENLVPVALLAGGDVDLLQVDLDSVAFAGARAESYAWEDVNGDGSVDLLFQFPLQNTELDKDSTQGTLTLLTVAGVVYQGTDLVQVVPQQ